MGEEKEECKTHVNDDNVINPKKLLIIRPGDWYCRYCKNLNFSYRIFCNRCRLSKFYFY